MAYSNGRIYVDTSVTPNVGVSIGDLQRCFAAVIEATIAGQTVRKLSGDLAVYCALKTGDTFTDGGVTWRVVSRAEVNPWARYRPIPCNVTVNGVENNQPTPISDQTRLMEQYGFDMPIDLYMPDSYAAYNRYVESVKKYGEYWMPLRPFTDRHWKRLTDFVRTNDNGTAVGSVGYDHNAKPDEVKVTITGGLNAEQTNGVHFLEPLVPDGSRYIVIPPGSASDGLFPFPNDHLWMDMYFQKIYDTLPSGTVVVSQSHPEWLSPIDLMGSPDYKVVVGGASYYTSVRRRLAIFRMRDGNGQWTDNPDSFSSWSLWCYVTDTTTATEGRNLRSRPHNKFPKAWVDFRTNGYTGNVFQAYGTPGQLSGRILVVECWVGENNSQNVMPIPGYTYELNIIRQNIQIAVDISSTFYFWYVEMQEYTVSGTGASRYDYVLVMYYSPSAMGLQTVITNNAQAVAALGSYFETLAMTVGTTTVNLLENSQAIEYVDGGYDAHHSGYRRLECVFLTDSPDNMYGQTVVIAGKRVNTGAIPAQTKSLVIVTDEGEIVSS